jgi:hypothetical protein
MEPEWRYSCQWSLHILEALSVFHILYFICLYLVCYLRLKSVSWSLYWRRWQLFIHWLWKGLIDCCVLYLMLATYIYIYTYSLVWFCLNMGKYFKFSIFYVWHNMHICRKYNCVSNKQYFYSHTKFCNNWLQLLLLSEKLQYNVS